MKILHTADWHIGKVLYKHELKEEIILFFDWLISTIETEGIDVLLISGDIFDLANPAVKDRQLYYQFLSRLIHFNIKVVITGGNHDAVGLLNAPGSILRLLNINIIGGAKANIEEELIELRDSNNELYAIIAAVPFLRDRDLRNKNTDTKYKNRVEAIREGIKNHYAQLAGIAQIKYPNTPLIAMGHLYASGSVLSDSERDIHIGNAAAIDSSIFDNAYKYVALGHIHRPQIVGKNQYIRYSGSPIALSFSERQDNKSVCIISVENNKITEPYVMPIPKQRELLKIKGTQQEITKELKSYVPKYTLPSFVELEIAEDDFNPLIISEVDKLVASYSNESSFKILKSRITFKEGGKDTSKLFAEGTHINDITPIDVFEKMIENRDIDKEDRILLQNAFSELLDEVLENEGV